MKRIACFLVLLLSTGFAPAQEAAHRAMQIDDLFRFKRLERSANQPGRQMGRLRRRHGRSRGQQVVNNLWLASTDPKGPAAAPAHGQHQKRPPSALVARRQDILFESNRSGSSQLWVIDLGGGEARQLTTISHRRLRPASGRPTASTIAFVSAVYPEYSDKPFKEKPTPSTRNACEEIEKNPVKAKVFTRLFFRHWDAYVEDKRQHLFVMAVEEAAKARPSRTRRDARRPRRLPDLDHVLRRRRLHVQPRRQASRLHRRAREGRGVEHRTTTCAACRSPAARSRSADRRDNEAADGAPQFSPDGKWLAYRAQKRAGFEADSWELMSLPRRDRGKSKGKPREPHRRSSTARPTPSSGCPTARRIYFAAEDRARTLDLSHERQGRRWPR